MDSHKKIILWSSCIVGITIILFGIWKLQHGLYNALDLAIYTQTAWNTIHGDFLFNSIQGTHYFADHVEPLLFVVIGFFGIVSHPTTLIVIQAVAVLSSVIPLYKLATRHLSRHIALGVSIAFLFFPLVWNTLLFEFHMLAFAIPILFWLLYAYQEKHFTLFLVFSVMALLVREDVALAVFGVGLLAAIDRRSWRWWLIPMAISLAWFVFALELSQSLAGEGYKFSIYYAWLGDSLPSMLTTLFSDPLFVLSHVLSFNNILFLISLVLLFLGLPIIGIRGLVPAIPVFAQLLFGLYNTKILLGTHYAAQLIPFLFFASVLGIIRLQKTRLFQLFPRMHLPIAVIVICILLLFNFVAIGPVRGLAKNSDTRWAGADSIVTDIPVHAPVAASYAYLPTLATRADLYSLHYIALGHKQFSSETYALNPEPEYVLLDLEDFTSFEYQFLTKQQFDDERMQIPKNLRSFLEQFQIKSFSENSLLVRRENGGLSTREFLASISTQDTAELQISQWTSSAVNNFLSIAIPIQKTPDDSWDDVAIRIESEGDFSITVPLAWHLYAREEVETAGVLTMNIPVSLPPDAANFTISLLKRNGFVGLSNHRGSTLFTESELVLWKESVPVSLPNLED